MNRSNSPDPTGRNPAKHATTEQLQKDQARLDATYEALQRQSLRYKQLFNEWHQKNRIPWDGKDPSPEEHADFANALLICPTEEAVSSLIGRNRGASLKLSFSADETPKWSATDLLLQGVRVESQDTPFSVFAEVVIKWNERALRRKNGEE